MIPAEDINTNKREDSCQRWKNLLGDIVGGIQSQSRILQDFCWAPYQLDKGQSRGPINNDIWYSFSNPRLRAPVISKHFPVQTQMKFIVRISQKAEGTFPANSELSLKP